MTQPRDALSQASRGQQIKRECLGTRLRRTFNKIILITGSSKLQTKAYSREIFLPGSISTNDKPKLSIIIIIITTIIGASADRGETQNCKRFFQRGRTRSSRDFAEITLPVIVFPSQNHGTQNNKGLCKPIKFNALSAKITKEQNEWIFTRFWQTAHLPCPKANILP